MDYKQKQEIVLAILALITSIIIILELLVHLEHTLHEILLGIDIGILIIFWAIFFIDLKRAGRKLHFVFKSWADLLGMLPIVAGPYTLLRLFRLLRVLRVFRILRLIKLARLMKTVRVLRLTKIERVFKAGEKSSKTINTCRKHKK